MYPLPQGQGHSKPSGSQTCMLYGTHLKPIFRIMIFMFIGFGAYNDREWLGVQGGEERKREKGKSEARP